jgi:hypothetical protein
MRPARQTGLRLMGIGIFAAVAALGQTQIQGTVRDSTGTAVPQALVEALPKSVAAGEKGSLGDRLNPWIPTDGDGKFSMTLPPGRYKIRAKAEALGYPDPVYWLNSDPTAIFPEITVGDGNAEARHVTVTLGKQGGILDGELIDRASKSPIAHGKITIHDAANPDAYVEIFSNKEGQFQFTVPSKPIIISAQATGHEAGNFAGGANITLYPGERREVEIELQHR